MKYEDFQQQQEEEEGERAGEPAARMPGAAHSLAGGESGRRSRGTPGMAPSTEREDATATQVGRARWHHGRGTLPWGLGTRSFGGMCPVPPTQSRWLGAVPGELCHARGHRRCLAEG